MSSLNILVIGECGDGKSKLVKHYTEKKGIPGPEDGLAPDGKTKVITKYDVGEIGGRTVTLIDTPGVGDKDVTPGKLVPMIEAYLANDKINGVILCSNISKLRITLGARVVAMLADKGFVGQSKWGEFILAGTQADRCDEKEIDNFVKQQLPSLNAECSGNINKVAIVSLKKGATPQVSQLEAAIQRLPGNEVVYKKPDEKVLASAIGQILDIPPVVLEKEIIKYRENIDSVLTSILKGAGKVAASVGTIGMLGWHGDTPVFGAWNSKSQ